MAYSKARRLAQLLGSDGTVASGKIPADAIDGTKIADDAINSEHYTDISIDTAHIGDDQVTAAKLANAINTDIATGVTANTTANAALPKAGGAMTGAITTNSTFDGVDIATRDAILTSTTTTANAAAPLASPTLTGTPAAPTASGSTSTTQLATTAFVQQELTTLIGGAPSTLNDLNELAAAINDDANYNSTLTTALATKLPLAGGTMTGNIAHAGNFTLDVGGNIELDADGGQVIFLDGGTQIGRLQNTSSNFVIKSAVNDKDIIFQGEDGGSNITALTLDMSEAGNAVFNGSVSAPGGFINGANGGIRVHSGGTKFFNITAANAARDGIMDIGAADARFKDLHISNDLKLTSGSEIYFGERGNLKHDNSNYNMSFNTNSLSNALVITGTGKVGIGVSDPDSKLEIKGAGGGSGLTFKTTDASSNETFFITDGGGAGVRYYPFSIGVPSSTSIVSGTRMFIDGTSTDITVASTGYLGIGTTGPRATLDVRGGHSSSINEAISFGRTDDDYRYNSIFSRNTSSTNSYLSFKIHDGGSSVAQTETMVIAPGKVGIGTAAPQRLLHLQKTGGDSAILRIDTNNQSHVAGIELMSGHGNWGVYNSDTIGDALEFRDDSAGVTRMIIDSEGDVGIGTTQTRAKLTSYIGNVTGKGVLANSGLHIANGTGTNAFGQITFGPAAQTNASSYIGELVVDTAGNTHGEILFGTRNVTTDTAPTERMRITSAGDVGIGIASPSGKLHVDGTSYFTNTMHMSGSAKLQFVGGSYMELDQANSNADLVFKKGSTAATLMTLNAAGDVTLGGTDAFYNVLTVGRTGTSGQGAAHLKMKTPGASYMDWWDAGSGNTIRLHTHSVNLRMVDQPNGDPCIQFEAAGNIDIDGSYLSGGFDYAEYFESTDGTAIPVGTTVVLVNEKVRAATGSEQPLGVVRPGSDGTSVVGGAAHLKWDGKYLKDDYDAYLYDTVDYWTWKDVGDTNETGDEDQQCWSDRVPAGWTVPNNKTITPMQRKRLNPDFVENLDADGNQIYSNREERDEWNCIGLLGQVPITKGQAINSNWTKLKDRSATVELWFIK